MKKLAITLSFLAITAFTVSPAMSSNQCGKGTSGDQGIGHDTGNQGNGKGKGNAGGGKSNGGNSGNSDSDNGGRSNNSSDSDTGKSSNKGKSSVGSGEGDQNGFGEGCYDMYLKVYLPCTNR